MTIDRDMSHPGWSFDLLYPGESHSSGLADRTAQDELNLFLQLELSHSLGSYGVTVHGMRGLLQRMTDRGSTESWGALFPRDALARMCDYNEALRANLHKPVELRNDRSALRSVEVPSQHPDPGEALGGEDVRYQWVLDFYASANLSLEFAAKIRDGKPTKHQKRFGRNLMLVRDPQSTGAPLRKADAMVRGRIARNTQRLTQAKRLFNLEPHADRAKEIIKDHLGLGSDGAPLHTQVIGALVEAHIRMHRAEHLISHSFGDKVRRRSEIDQMVEHELERSLVLNTFAYAASRCVPWIFAAREEERKYVVKNYSPCCDTMTPTYCMWLANQVTLLALQRRAFTLLVFGDEDRAHNDFQKVKRLARGIEHQMEERIARPAGGQVFLRCLSAFADHHSGRLYRVQHAYSAALRHFDRAGLRLQPLERNTEVTDLLCNSRWRINLLISQGKASYELGLVKQTLGSLIRAWRAFLELADTESSPRANFEVVDGVIEWLDGVIPDAEVNKAEVVNRMTPLVRQIQVVRGPTHLRVLAADILIRLAHVLVMLRLPRMQGDKVLRDDSGGDNSGVPLEDHELAYRCLLQAARLDQSQTLIAADLLKARRWKRENEEVPDKVPTMASLDVQWPGGGGQFEEAVRVVEYVLQSWLDAAKPTNDESPERQIARGLLTSFLVHTDSTNVKLAQVYRYLMQDPTKVSREDLPDETLSSVESTGSSASPGPLAGAGKTPYMELVCLRRYSSFFPFVPRPMAFRVVGGGYFLRIFDPENREIFSDDQPDQAFGVAIDPGPNFIDNLYRSNYCLADIHMILVTHDHADHMAALDPMLALLGTRKILGAKTFDKEHKLIILGNKSVKKRYDFYNDADSKDDVRVLKFKQWEKRKDEDIELLLAPPSALSIESVSTWGHEDAGHNGAQGVLVSLGAGETRSSVLFTSDMGPIDEEQRRLRRKPESRVVSPGKSIEEAIEEATVVVVHVSAVPLPQLRRIAGLTRAPESICDKMKAFERIWKALYTQIEDREKSGDASDASWAHKRRFLVRQLQFGFHSGPAKRFVPSEELRVSPLSPEDMLEPHSQRHLYLDGLLAVATRMQASRSEKLLVIGELHEELGTFRTRIARALNEFLFADSATNALTADIGLTVRVQGSSRGSVKILCTTCALDNDLVDVERFHLPHEICEVCVKGEDEGIFYNCKVHDPQRRLYPAWVERVERYDPFGR